MGPCVRRSEGARTEDRSNRPRQVEATEALARPLEGRERRERSADSSLSSLSSHKSFPFSFLPATTQPRPKNGGQTALPRPQQERARPRAYFWRESGRRRAAKEWPAGGDRETARGGGGRRRGRATPGDTFTRPCQCLSGVSGRHVVACPTFGVRWKAGPARGASARQHSRRRAILSLFFRSPSLSPLP